MPGKKANQFICSSLMLPEHREALNRRTIQAGKEMNTGRPFIAEQQHALWDYLLDESLKQGKRLSVTWLEDGCARLVKGVVCGADLLGRKVSICNGGNISRICRESIICLEEA